MASLINVLTLLSLSRLLLLLLPLLCRLIRMKFIENHPVQPLLLYLSL